MALLFGICHHMYVFCPYPVSEWVGLHHGKHHNMDNQIYAINDYFKCVQIIDNFRVETRLYDLCVYVELDFTLVSLYNKPVF